jgi:DNA-binding GntR family transcriptional regulator
MAKIAPIDRPPTLTSSVLASLKELILRGGVHPGEPLREVELSESLQVSRTTVREALIKLAEEKIVEIIPHRGAFVAKLSKRTAKELYTLRAILEPCALKLALEKDAFSEEDKSTMADLAARLNDLDHVEELQYETVTTDIDLHWLMCSRSDHELLVDTLKGLQSLNWLYLSHFTAYGCTECPDAPTHLDVVQAIIDGDAVAAVASLEEMINASGAALLAKMEADTPRD